MDDGVIGLSISCDGVRWAPLIMLTSGLAFENRSVDHPCDGFVTRGGTVFAHVHRNVPQICKGRQHMASYLEPHALDSALLQRLSRARRRRAPDDN